MAKSIGVQLHLSDRHTTLMEHAGEIGSASSSRSRTAVIFPQNIREAGTSAREALLAISNEHWQPNPETQGPGRPVRLRIEPLHPALMVSGASKSVHSTKDIRLQTSPLAHSSPFQLQSTLRTYRSMAVLSTRKGTVKGFEMGRNILNRLEVKTAKEQRRVNSLTYLRGRVEDQRNSMQYRNTVRVKERSEVLEDIHELGKQAKTAKEAEMRDKDEQGEREIQKARMGVRRKRSPARSLLFINSLNPQLIPQAKERTFTLSDLQVLLSATQPKRFRFK